MKRIASSSKILQNKPFSMNRCQQQHKHLAKREQEFLESLKMRQQQKTKTINKSNVKQQQFAKPKRGLIIKQKRAQFSWSSRSRIAVEA